MNSLRRDGLGRTDVLKFIWRYEPVTCGLITHGMQERNSWHPSTTKTLIRRLLDKNVITFNTSKTKDTKLH